MTSARILAKSSKEIFYLSLGLIVKTIRREIPKNEKNFNVLDSILMF